MESIMTCQENQENQWPEIRCKCGFVGEVDPSGIYMGVYKYDPDRGEEEIVPCPECDTHTPMDCDVL